MLGLLHTKDKSSKVSKPEHKCKNVRQIVVDPEARGEARCAQRKLSTNFARTPQRKTCRENGCAGLNIYTTSSSAFVLANTSIPNILDSSK